MLHGIDISNWQRGLSLPESLDFVICKATGGTGFVDQCCDKWIQEAKKKGILFGFYHFAGDGWDTDPEKEAVFFYQNTKGYVHEGIPVLDIEDSRIVNWGDYAQRFVDKYHACSGVYPVIYASASTLGRFAGYPLVDDCGLWIAGYPSNRDLQIGDVPKFPYGVSPWKFAAMWQYTSNGWIGNWDSPVDLDVAFMDVGAWKLYANPSQLPPDETVLMPDPVESPEKDDAKSWHFENGKLSVDVTLKS